MRRGFRKSIRVGFKNKLINKMKKLLTVLVTALFTSMLLSSCGGGSNESDAKKISGSISGTTYYGTTNVNLDANQSILMGQGYEYGYILEHVWKIAKDNSAIEKADINFIINGDDGYGNKKIATWPHLVFNSDELNELRRYSDLSKMDWSSKADMLDLAGMLKLKDSKGDLSPDVFK